jgi:hypothetical protein
MDNKLHTPNTFHIASELFKNASCSIRNLGNVCLAEVKQKNVSGINIETRRSTTPGKRVILVQGPC